MFNYYWGEIRNGGLKSCRKKKTTIAQNCDEIKIKTDYKEIARSVWYTWPRKLNVEEKILFHCNALIEWFIKAFQTLLQQFDVFPFGWGKHCVCLERKRNPSLVLLWKTCEQFYFALTTFEQCNNNYTAFHPVPYRSYREQHLKGIKSQLGPSWWRKLLTAGVKLPETKAGHDMTKTLKNYPPENLHVPPHVLIVFYGVQNSAGTSNVQHHVVRTFFFSFGLSRPCMHCFGGPS